MKNGCLRGLPDNVCSWVGYHSKYPSAGSRQRRDANARLYAGFSATVSIRALIIRLPLEGYFAPAGTRRHVGPRSCRVGGSGSVSSRLDGDRSITAYTALVGATLKSGWSASSTRLPPEVEISNSSTRSSGLRLQAP